MLTAPSTRSVKPFGVQRCTTRCSARNRTVSPRAGLFDLFTGGSGKGSAAAQQLVEDLLEASRVAGSKPTPSRKEEIANLADQLRKYRPRAPTRNPLFWGEYKVVYSSNPNATGGPVLRSGPGQLVFGGQKPRQLLQKPDTLVNIVDYKTLGLIPGTITQEAKVSVLDGNKFQVDFDARAVNRGESVTRKFEVLYLDDRARVVQFIPEEKDREPSLFVFERIVQGSTEEEVGDDEEASVSKPQGIRRSGTKKIASAKPQPKSPEEEQLEKLSAELQELQQSSRSVAQELREKEKGAGASVRAAKPARAQVERAQQEADGVQQQLAEAIQAAQAAEARYKQAASDLRQLEKAGR